MSLIDDIGEPNDCKQISESPSDVSTRDLAPSFADVLQYGRIFDLVVSIGLHFASKTGESALQSFL